MRAGIAYLAASWLLVQLLETLFPILGLAEVAVGYFATDKYLLVGARW
jgi:hypothetical protein